MGPPEPDLLSEVQFFSTPNLEHYFLKTKLGLPFYKLRVTNKIKSSGMSDLLNVGQTDGSYIIP